MRVAVNLNKISHRLLLAVLWPIVYCWSCWDSSTFHSRTFSMKINEITPNKSTYPDWYVGAVCDNKKHWTRSFWSSSSFVTQRCCDYSVAQLKDRATLCLCPCDLAELMTGKVSLMSKKKPTPFWRWMLACCCCPTSHAMQAHSKRWNDVDY